MRPIVRFPKLSRYVSTLCYNPDCVEKPVGPTTLFKIIREGGKVKCCFKANVSNCNRKDLKYMYVDLLTNNEYFLPLFT